MTAPVRISSISGRSCAAAILVCCALLWSVGVGTAAASSPWTASGPLAMAVDGSPFAAGTAVFQLDASRLESALDQAPHQDDAGAPWSTVDLPLPDGTVQTFRIARARTMSPELAAKYPEIRAFVGRGPTSQWRAVFEWSLGEFAASIRTPAGQVIIRPAGGADSYGSAYWRDLTEWENRTAPTCEFESDPVEADRLATLAEEMTLRGGVGNGAEIRSYRLAVAATGEYTQQHGGTVAGGLAQIVETVNRINEIMGLDWAVSLQLVPNNDLVVFTNPATDPYSNGETYTMLGQNQSTMNSIIGSANYDVGHVFGTGGGGVAYLSSVCGPSKARGVSTANNTGGESFALLAAHEMGHQYGSPHTFNGTEGNCGPNRSASTAFEPGSGTTIMSYAGICGSQNIQAGSSPYYSTGTYTRVIANITGGTGSSCPVLIPSGNTPPMVVSNDGGFAIPLDTPFTLTGDGYDADGDELTYCWEEYDLGPAGHPDEPVGTAPLFRSIDPKTVPFRHFPKMIRTVKNDHRIGEILPFYERRMNFRLTVRDGLGGVHFTQIAVDAKASAGPFRVTSQSVPEFYDGGSTQTVTWDVANTDNAEVNCQAVDIYFAPDQYTYSYLLAAGVPNNGSASVVIPNVDATKGRIKVAAADNIFFDLNDADITVTASGVVGVGVTSLVEGLELRSGQPNPFVQSTRFAYSVPASGAVQLRVFDAAGRLVRVLQEGPVESGGHVVTWDGRGRGGAVSAPGVYFVRLEHAGEARMQKVLRLR